MPARTLVDLFEQRVSESGDAPALRHHDGDSWATVSFADWLRTSTLLAAGLVRVGVEVGDRVAILSSTRIEWVYADQAILLAGGTVVPVYETIRPRQARIILDDAGASVVFVEDPHQLSKLLEVIGELPSVRHIVYFDELGQLPEIDTSGRTHLRLDDLSIAEEVRSRLIPLSQLREMGARALGADPNTVSERRRRIVEESLASIVYTAGTTGRPRGVALAHSAFVAQVDGNLLALPLGPSDEQVLFLPLAQILARSIYLTMAVAGGVSTFSRGMGWFERDVQATNPTLIVGVPRVFEKILENVRRRIIGGSEMRKRLAARADAIAIERSEAREGLRPWGLTARLRYASAEALYFAPLRRVFGKRFRFAVSGGSQMRLERLRILDGAGIQILEGYGLTEHCGAVSVNRPDDNRIGTVGRPLPGVELRIASDGEILVRSSCVMREYWKDPEATVAALAGAWLHSGDIGELDGNHLRVTDRKRDVFVTDTGRVVAPSPIEAQLQASPFIEHAIVHGDGRRFLSALVTLNGPAVREWAADHGLGRLTNGQLATHPEVFALISGVIDGVNAELPRAEAIGRFAVLGDDFSTNSGELTATGKTRRLFVTRKYASVLDGFYE